MLKGAEANRVTVNGDRPREGRSPRGTRYTCLPLGGARAGLVVGEIVPRTALLAVILADRAHWRSIEQRLGADHGDDAYRLHPHREAERIKFANRPRQNSG